MLDPEVFVGVLCPRVHVSTAKYEGILTGREVEARRGWAFCCVHRGESLSLSVGGWVARGAVGSHLEREHALVETRRKDVEVESIPSVLPPGAFSGHGGARACGHNACC